MEKYSSKRKDPGFVPILFNIKFALAIVLILYASIIAKTFFISQSQFPGGVDASTHLFQISLIANEGLSAWNHWWYAGHPLLDQYPFLSHAVGAFFSLFLGVEGAYKIVASIVFISIPLAFFFFLSEFKLSERQKSFALYFFSFSPVFTYYLEGGVFSALFSLPFVILFFKFLVRSLNSHAHFTAMLFSSLFIALASLSHLFTPVAAGAFAFIYLIAFKRDLLSFKKLALIGILAALMVAFFWVPLVLNYEIRGSSFTSISASSLASALAPFGRAFAVYINYVSVGVLLFIAALVLFSLKRDFENKKFCSDFTSFFVLSVILVIFWVLFLPHSGQAAGKLPLFIPIFFSLFLAQHFGENKVFTAVSSILLLLMLFSVLSIYVSYVPLETYEMAEWAAANTQNRALFLPQGFGLVTECPDKPNTDAYLYDVYLLPNYFQKENYWGWFGETAPHPQSNDRINFVCTSPRTINEIASEIGPTTKIIFQKMKTCTVNASSEEFCKILREGAVDSVFINSNFPEVAQFADKTECLKKSGTNDKIIYYSVTGTKPYISSESGNIKIINYYKKSGTINLKINSEGSSLSATIIIRESYYPYWEATVYGQKAQVEESEYGFIKLPVNLAEGTHEIILSYSANAYSVLFRLISALVWILMFFALIIFR